MDFMLSRATRVTAQWASAPVQHAVARFWRDMEMTLSTTGFVPDNRLMICLAPALPPESYTLDVTENQLTLCAADDLGAVYGLLDISRHYLGVTPFWFWNQQQFEPKPFATVPEGRITGPAAAVGLRGWDLSDAPWLSAWADATENGWEMIFESLLRYRGNMVRTDKQADLAAAMGLRPVQNPQTPLGAAPQQAAAENPEERHKIWQDSIRTLKTSPRIWALGIDGMGGDPDGTASTAALQEQWQLLNATVPGAVAYILLQGETVALYQEGKLKIPDSVIPVLTPAPSASSAGGPGPGAQHGLWFSLCRRDKLTGNPMTAYPGGDTAVNGMLQGAWRGGVRSFWMVGTGDLRPSLMELNLTGALWCTPDTDCAAQRTAYLRCTYRAPDGWALTDSALEDLSVCLRARAESAVQAGRARFRNLPLCCPQKAMRNSWLPISSSALPRWKIMKRCCLAVLTPGGPPRRSGRSRWCSACGCTCTPCAGRCAFAPRGSSFWIRTGRTAFAPWAVRRMILVPWQLCCSQKLGSGPAFAAIPCWTAH